MSAGSVDDEWSYIARRMEFSETSWLLERIGVSDITPFTSGGSAMSLQMSYNMSQEYGGFVISKYDCSCDLPDDIMDIDVISTRYEGNETLHNVTIELELNTSGITTSDIYTELDDGEGEFAFCVRGELYALPDDNVTNGMLVNFDETVFNITVDTEGEFTSDVDLVREDASEVEDSFDYGNFVEVYQCDENRDPISDVALSQGSLLTVCVGSKDESVVLVEEIKDLELTQVITGGSNEFTAIEDGGVVYDSLVTMNCVNGVCQVQMMLVGKFFAEDDPNDVTLSGSVKLYLPGSSTARRYLEVSSSKRGLEATEGGFEMNIKVESVSQTDSSSGHKNMVIAYVLAGLLYLVMG